ncbi:MAG: heme lyase CcmF/NrfE family subunit [Hyphomonadaceae bacterium]|nr:heme lyase CcmF/NrfE family subunit [Hyphomonadaceae bacterium]
MTVELGHYALVLAFVVAIVQSASGLWGAHARSPHAMSLAGPAAIAQGALVTLAFLMLMNAYLASDFSVANVYNNSHSAKPVIYKIAGVWGNHEGSMLLWIVMLGVLGGLVATVDRHLPPTLRARVLGVQGLISVAFLAFCLFTSNPFERMDPAPVDGRDLNPLLQDPGLAFHPPFLYLGIVGFSVAFSFGVAALLESRVDPAWARWVRPWTLVAWTSLTLGIGMGSWWAYYELGWGGFWFWDPVENASLIPWLAGTALLHSAAVVEKRDTLKAWTILMAIAAFTSSVLGTFVVRSGLLTSVHAFANDPARGTLLLILCVLMTGGALTLYALRANALKPGGGFHATSRETALVVNNVLLSALLFAVAIGTFWPIFAEVFFGDRVSVGAPYYNRIAVPLTVLLAIAMSFGMQLPWKRASLRAAARRLRAAVAVTVAAMAATFWLAGKAKALSMLGVGMGVWIVMGAALDVALRLKIGAAGPGEILRRAGGLPRSAWGAAIAHGGLGLLIIGIVGTTVWVSERVEVMRPGEAVEIAGYTLTYEKLEQREVANYQTEIGTFAVSRDGRRIGELTPERRWYPVAEMATTEAAIRLRPLEDIYVVLGDPRDAGPEARVVRAYHHPLVSLLWGGALVMVLGGVVSLTDGRYRVGAPARKRAPAATGDAVAAE